MNYPTSRLLFHVSRESNRTPNKPDAVNPAMALRLAIDDQWRRVTDLERYPLGNLYGRTTLHFVRP